MNIKANTKWYAFVPNLVTTLNLLCGATALFFAFHHNISIAFILMIAGAFFDFADGMLARLLKVSGEVGKQLDSLADLVTFGVLPAAMVFSAQQSILNAQMTDNSHYSVMHWIYLLSPLFIVALSALRLAKFNIDTRQSNSFIGLPTPANALFFASLSYSIFASNSLIGNLADNNLLLFILTIVFSLLLVTPLPMFSLKFSNLSVKSNLIRYVFLLLALLIILFFKTDAISVVILLYIFISFLSARTHKLLK